MIENLQCPICGGQMVSRLNVAKHTRFWGCKNYPTCKGTRNTDGEAAGERDRPVSSAGVGDLFPSERARENDKYAWRRR